MQKLERSRIELYIGIAIGILLAVLPMTWWLRILGLLAVEVLAVDLSFRSPLMFNTHVGIKIGTVLSVLFILAAASWNTIRSEYRADHPIATVDSPGPQIQQPQPRIVPLPPPTPTSKPQIQILYQNADLNGQTIVSGGREDVVNGLIIPTFQIKNAGNRPTASLSVRLYLSEGGARWDGPWQPVTSNDHKLPAAYYWGGQIQVSPGEPWDTPSFIAQKGKGEPWSSTILGKVEVFYGALHPAIADFAIVVVARGHGDGLTPGVFPNRHMRTDQAEALAIWLDQISTLHSVKILASMQDAEAWDYAADFVRAVRQAKRVKLVGDGMFDNPPPGYSGLGILLGQEEDWRTAFAAEVDAAFARAQLRVHARGVKPAIPGGEIDIVIGFNDGT